MPANTFTTSAPERAAAPRGDGAEGPSQRLTRRLRDLLIMGAVGPVVGVAAIFALHQVLPAQGDVADDAARQREADRALAILEDRPWPSRAVASLPDNRPAQLTTAQAPTAPALPELTSADFRDYQPTPDARHMADWVVARHDNGRLPFIVLDKRDARLYVFRPNGELVDQTPVLLGSAHGDETYPGIGDVPIPEVKPYQRTTAAGRFVTRPGLDADHTDVVWLDYDAALAMHRVINKVKSERRLQRLASANPKVRRISWGCINIPVAFFDSYISPVFGKHTGVTYVIPERKSFAEVFEQGGGVPQMVATSAGPLAPKDVAQR